MLNIKENELLCNHTTFHLGGEAKYFCIIKNINELKQALSFVKENMLSYFVLGSGSNVVVSDEGFCGVIIKIKSEKLKIRGCGVVSRQCILDADAGVSLAMIVKKSFENGLVGMEWANGIPGTIGGAVRGNAGAYGGEIKDHIKSVKVLRNGKIIELNNKECKFGYRDSLFKNNKDIILSVKIKLEKGSDKDIKKVKEIVEMIRKERVYKFAGGFSAGSFFKNVILNKKEIKKLKNNFPKLPDQFVEYKKIPAAWLIDQCGLRGFCIGDLCISEKHAGILINKGKGKSDELHQLVSLIKMKVRDKFSLELQEEIQYL